MKNHLLLLMAILFPLANVYSWDGSIASRYAGGDGTVNNPYQIATAEQLAFLASNVNDSSKTYSGQYFVLTADIDLFGKNGEDTIQWRPIGHDGETSTDDQDASHRTFSGTFDGQNHIIRNLYINGDIRSAGLFGRIGSSHLQNIRFENVYIYARDNIGALCGHASYDSYIDNCHVESGTIIIKKYCYYAGGLVGNMKGQYQSWHSSSWDYIHYHSKISRCSNRAHMISQGPSSFGLRLAGIVGAIGGYDNRSCCKIEDCVNYGDIEGANGLGGICGEIYYTKSITYDSIQIDNCHNYGDIIISDYSQQSESGLVGGILGKIECGSMGAGILRRCTNSGNINPTMNYYDINPNTRGMGGIVGSAFSGAIVEYCANTGFVYQRDHTGGICGYSSGTIRYCLNAGETAAYGMSGGIAGQISNTYECLSVNANRAAVDRGEIAGKGGSSAQKCFFDKQNILWTYGAYGTYETETSAGWGKFTHQMTGNGLASSLSNENWVFADGMYPRPKGIENQDITIVAATPILLKYDSDNSYDDLRAVHCSLETGDVQGVKWSTESPLVINEHIVFIVDSVPAGKYYSLQAQLGNAKRLYEFSAKSYGKTDTIKVNTDKSYNFNGQTLSSSGIYTASFPTSGDCDSTVVLLLTIKATPQLSFADDITACQTDLELALPFTLQKGAAHEATISFDSKAQKMGFADGAFEIESNHVIIPMPAGVDAGPGKASVIVRDTLANISSSSYSVPFEIMLDGYLHQKFGTVLLVDNNPDNGKPNASSDKAFKAFQWYKNGEKLSDATEAFIYEPNGLNGTYQVELTTTDNIQFLSCPITLKRSGKAPIMSANVIEQGTPITILPEYIGNIYYIYTAQGLLWSKGVISDGLIKAPLDKGYYIFVLTDMFGNMQYEKILIK